MVLVTRHEPRSIVEILRREVDPPPSILRCLLTLNASYFAGTSPVCGHVTESGFELRNRTGPGFSLRVKGAIAAGSDGSTKIALSFSKPSFPDLLGVLGFGRYRRDRETIVSFLEQQLGAVERKAG